jgi:hypothetical protein
LEASNSANVSLQEKYNQFALQSNKASDEIAYWRRKKNADVQLSIAKSTLAAKEGRLQETVSLVNELEIQMSALQIQNNETAMTLSRERTKVKRRDERLQLMKSLRSSTDPRDDTSSFVKQFAAKKIFLEKNMHMAY